MDDESHLLILIEKEETSKRLGGLASGVYRLKKAIQLDKRFTIRGAYEYVN
jgi:hypothetical protein